jgi:hypothetical protein
MAHQVRFHIPERELGNADIEFRVRKGKRKKGLIGTLKISQGAVVWSPGYSQRGFKIGWSTLAKLISKHGRRGDF